MRRVGNKKGVLLSQRFAMFTLRCRTFWKYSRRIPLPECRPVETKSGSLSSGSEGESAFSCD